MDDVDTENLNALQGVAQDFLASDGQLLTDAVISLRDGRGDNMPGIGR